uniref:F-box domain-containing protein n=1 Tax=Brassica campestris TaxID=3711 RepID=A0A3P6AYE0_BRACM|nr:unnamed protein product [Brassica rapa]
MPLMEKPDNREMDLLTDGLPPIPILLTKIPKISGTESLLEDLYAIILAKLPLTSIITFKRVCKQWKSLVESPFAAIFICLCTKTRIILLGRSCVEVARQKPWLTTDPITGVLPVLSVLTSRLF